MKYLISAFTAFLFLSCDPDNKDIFNLERLQIKGSFKDTSSVISLGSTVTLNIKLPDTLTSSSETFIVESLQKALFTMIIEKIDTVGKMSRVVRRELYWTSRGSISATNPLVFHFNTDAKPYGVTIHFKPEEKGIYMFDVASQAGQTKINNTLEPRLVVDFAVPDKRIYLVEPFLGPSWTSLALSSEFGIYVFRVN